jgi:hypothetical protein
MRKRGGVGWTFFQPIEHAYLTAANIVFFDGGGFDEIERSWIKVMIAGNDRTLTA